MSISPIIPLFQYLHGKQEKGAFIARYKRRYWDSIISLLFQYLRSGISRADPRAAAQSSTVVYCCFVVVSRAILWIYNHSQCRIRYIM